MPDGTGAPKRIPTALDIIRERENHAAVRVVVVVVVMPLRKCWKPISMMPEFGVLTGGK